MLKLRNKTLLAIGVIGVNLAAVSLPFVAHADTQTSQTTVQLQVNPVIISYSSGPTVTLGAITPTGAGKQSTGSDTVSANTNDTGGLTITMQENSATTTSMVAGSNNIATGAGTTASPVALANNTWGWRMDTVAGFGSGPTSTLSNAAPSALTYAGIPANGSPYTINTTSTNGSTSSTVWYSARVDNTQPIGNYSTVVLYTITTN
jgi:hypothetical protein